MEALPRLKFGASHAESHNFIFYKLELGVIANIESWENGLKSLSYSYSLLMLTSSSNDNDNDNDTDDDSEQFL